MSQSLGRIHRLRRDQIDNDLLQIDPVYNDGRQVGCEIEVQLSAMIVGLMPAGWQQLRA